MADDFLAVLKAHRRAPLKIYLGMAAGVGKTVAMLRDGKRLLAEGVDVVCAVLETHGREATLAESVGIELTPRKTLIYRGVPLEEMDLEAVLSRKPALALVDELAHTNVAGSKHEKRWQDVEELLDAGISVMATLNVQHLESLHEIVLRETGVDVRERIPDRIVSSADEVLVIDLPPAELQDRLREGKVYPPEKVEHALRRFFTSKNLAALRQLALREVANAVEKRGRRDPHLEGDAQRGQRAHPVDAERVMVSMSSRPSATRHLLRHGARLAGGLNSRWFVVYVRTSSETLERIDADTLRSLTENIRLAKELGAEVVRLEGSDVVAALADFARSKGITHAVFGRTGQTRLKERLRGSILSEFMRALPEVDVLVVGERREDGEGWSEL
ncbi:MAG TPA: universal stress protein [Polyangiaceae bacterium]|nr:universal stress protein [Polyangiaceae bacterium]